MALTSRATKKLGIPGEDGQSVTIRQLSHYQLSMAQDAKRDAALVLMKAIEGVTLPTPTADAASSAESPDMKFDRLTVLKFGVLEWSYDMAPNAGGAEDLDEDTAAWLFDQIIAFSVRSREEGEASGSDSTPITA